MNRDLEERLRTDAGSVRRPPSRALGERIRTAMVGEASEATRATVDDEEPMHSLRGRLKAASVAVTVLVAAAFWVVALFVVFGDAPGVGGRNDLAGGARPHALEHPDSPSLLAQLGRVIPVENPLAAELDRIGQDASRAARFLVGRLPAPLASNAPEDGRR